MSTPLISVIMPVYNAERFVGEAIESILGQTEGNFELIAVDDCSTDNSLEVMQRYTRDPRVTILHNDQNSRIVTTLNRGIDAATGTFIARMDADDISLPERFAKQMRHMHTHPHTAVCGTWARTINEHGEVIGKLKTPVGFRLRYEYWKPSPFIHPSVMIRRSSLGNLRYQNVSSKPAEDYHLWLHFQPNQLHNIPQYLLHYRILPSSISSQTMEGLHDSAYHSFIKHVGRDDLSKEEFEALFSKNLHLPLSRRVQAGRKVGEKLTYPQWVQAYDAAIYALRRAHVRLHRSR